MNSFGLPFVRLYRKNLSPACHVPRLRWLSLLGFLALAFAPNQGVCAGPSFVGPSTAISVNQDANAASIKYLLLVSDTDIGKTLTWSQNAAPSHGTLAFSSATASSGSTSITPGGTITYTPTALYDGADSFTVRVSDGSLTATRTISVTVDCIPIESNTSYVSARPGQIGTYWVETRGTGFGWITNNISTFGGIPMRGYFQFRVGSGAWQTLGQFGSGSTAPNGATIRYVDTNPANSTTGQSFFIGWNSAAGTTTTGMFVAPEPPPTGITQDSWVIWDISADGDWAADLTPIGLANGLFVLDSQSNTNLLAVSGTTLVLGSGAMPADGQIATATLTYYDPLQLDCDGNPITNNPILGAPAVQTLAFTIRNSTPDPKAEYVLGQPNFLTGIANLAANALGYPSAVAIDTSHGKAYVADAGNNRILRYAWPVTGNQPNAEVVFGQTDFVSSDSGCSPTAMNFPCGMSVDSSGNLWVVDGGNNRVLRFSVAYQVTTNRQAATLVLGQASFTVSTTATTAGGLNTPTSLTMDTAGNLWVADSGNNRVVRFASANSIASGASANGVLGQSSFTLNASATTQSGLNYPQDLTFTGTTLFVSDADNNRVLRFAGAASKANGGNADGVLGQLDFTSSDPQTTQDGLNNPYGLCVDAAGGLYVADCYNDRVLVFSNAVSKANGGNADAVIGTTSFTDTNLPGPVTQSLLYDPEGLAFDATRGVLAVADMNNSRVLVYGAPVLTATTSTVSGSPNPSIYGQSITFTATVTGTSGSTTPNGTVTFTEGSTTLGSGTLSGSGTSATATYSTSTLPAGNHTVTAAYSGDANFNGSSGSTSPAQTIGQATPIVTMWPTASAITYGQTLAGSTLSGGSATPAGGFAWTTSSTAPGAGTASQNVTFTPSDTTDYATVIGTASVTVNQATPTVTTWPAASAITYGQTLASSTLTGGSATPTGSFGWTTSSTAPGAGTASQSVTFTPSDATDYVTVTGTASVTVNPSPVSVLLDTNSLNQTYDGTARSVVVLSPTNLVVEITYDGSPNAPTNAGSYTVIGVVNNANYVGSVTNMLVIEPASQTIDFAALPSFVAGDPPYTLSATADSGLPVTFASSDNTVASVSGSTLTIVGIGTATITAAQAGDGSNYLAATNVSQPVVVSPQIAELAISLDTTGGFYTMTNISYFNSTYFTNVVDVYTNVTLTITGNQGRAYQLQFENDLAQSNWQTLFSTTNLPTASYPITDPATNSARFYRLRYSIQTQ